MQWKKPIQIKLLKCNGRLGELNFCLELKTVPDCTHFDESEKECQEPKKKKKKGRRGWGWGVRWTHKKPQTAHMTVSINTTLPIQINHHKQHWQCPLLAPSVLKWYENCVRVCGQNELEVCTTMAYPHFGSFHTQIHANMHHQTFEDSELMGAKSGYCRRIKPKDEQSLPQFIVWLYNAV